MVIFIRRADCNNDRSIGVLYTDGFACYTLELPWVNNQRNISCVPSGKYTAKVDTSVLIGGLPVIRLEDVPERDGILIHVANRVSQIQGCTAVGMVRSGLDEIGQSKVAMAALLNAVSTKPLIVDIDWA